MKNVKSILALLLALVMVLGLAACTPKDNAEDTKPAETKPAETKPAETQEKETTPAEREHVELIYYNYLNKEYPGLKETEEAINAYLKEKLNTTLVFNFCLQGDYNSNVGTHINSGGDFDIVFTRAGNVDFNTFAKAGAFLPLEDYMDEYLSGSQALFQEGVFDALYIDGHQYGVPVPRDAATNYNIQVNQTMLEDLGLTVPEYNNYSDLIDWIYEAKAARDAKYPEKADQELLRGTPTYINAFYTADYLWGNNIAINMPSGNGYAGQGDDAFCVFYTDEYRELAKVLYELVRDKICPFDASSFDSEKVLYKAGEFLFDWSLGTVFLNEEANMPSFMTRLYRAKDAMLSTSGYKSGYAVSADCEYPERALEVIELMNTDPYLATLLHFGPENVGWTDTDNDGVIEAGPANDVAAADRAYWYWYGWNLGGLTVSKLPVGYPSNFADLLNDMNNTAILSSVMGFSFDQTPVANEIAACNNVISEYNATILSGQNANYDQLIDEFVQKLKDNGMDKIVAEMNAQLDAFRAAK